LSITEQRAVGFILAWGLATLQVDYFKMFSSTAKLLSLWTILSIITYLDWDIKVFDYLATFLNGEFSSEAEIYIEQVLYYTNSNPKDVIQLWCIIYRLKQSSCKWYKKLTKKLRKLSMSWLGKMAKLLFTLLYFTFFLLNLLHKRECRKVLHHKYHIFTVTW